MVILLIITHLLAFAAGCYVTYHVERSPVIDEGERVMKEVIDKAEALKK